MDRVIVDHHPASDAPMEGLALRDPSASATGELVYDLLILSGTDWPPESTLGMYVALLTDTGSFRFSNTTGRVHRIVADLMERGLDPQKAARQVYGRVRVRKLHLLRASLEELQVEEGGGVAWMTVPLETYTSLGATSDDVDGLVDYPRSLRGVEVAILFRQAARGGTKVSLRSNGEVDVNRLARSFGGGGHVRAAGALVDRPLGEVRKEVVSAALEAVAETRGQEGGQ
jgi:phosphoesterase RecJ-like protein